MELVKKIGIFDDFENLKSKTIELLDRFQINQISLQVKKNDTSWDKSAGWLDSVSDELSFNKIHPELKDTVFDELILSINYKIFRMRIMQMPPNTSYSTHKDPLSRIHIPIITNDKCAFLFPENNYMKHMPADGSIYWTNTKLTHTFVNWSNEPRIHIVGTVIK
jgi:hypothetical protein